MWDRSPGQPLAGADLGNGIILYPLEAFSGMILSIVATILLWRTAQNYVLPGCFY